MSNQVIVGHKRNLARGLYRNTFMQQGFSVNDFRRLNYHNTSTIVSRSAIGAFFYDLKTEGFIRKTGEVKSEHPEAKGRKVSLWVWTEYAHSILRDEFAMRGY